MRRVGKQCYLPANLLLLKLIHKHPEIKITFSISGSALKQLEVFAPAVLESFQMLAATGNVEFLSETYYHSLAFLNSPDEFQTQVRMHVNKIKKLFGVTPTVFRNTELIYNDEIGRLAEQFGFKGIITDGIGRILHHRSPNHLYQHADTDMKILLRNFRLSDDIAFRFTRKDWKEWPLTPKKYVAWLTSFPRKEKMITLSMDYETFGEHQKKDSGIFKFLESTLIKIAKSREIKMITPSEAIQLLVPAGCIHAPESISWADEERDLSPWLGNDMQQDAFDTLSHMEFPLKRIGNRALLNTWRYLQTSDHFYYMSTKKGEDGSIHNYFSPYPTPYQAFMNYMNVLSDLALKIEQHRNLPAKEISYHGMPSILSVN